jgi:hypothetical protein
MSNSVADTGTSMPSALKSLTLAGLFTRAMVRGTLNGGHHHAGAFDAGGGEEGHLVAVADHDARGAQLVLDLLGPDAILLDDGHLVPSLEQVTSEGEAHLAAADDDDVGELRGRRVHTVTPTPAFSISGPRLTPVSK